MKGVEPVIICIIRFYAIEFVLNKDNEFIESDRTEIRNIRKILEKYGLTYKSSSLSNELQKSPFIIYEKHPNKTQTNLYSKNNKT